MSKAATLVSRNRGTDSVVLPVVRHLQQQSWSCGTASLKIVLDTIGQPTQEESLIGLSGAAPRFGTPPTGMAAALVALGIRHQVLSTGSVAALEERLRARELCIVNYQAWGRRGRDYHLARTGHYSVAYGFDGTHLLIADPAKGKKGPELPTSWGMRSIRKDLFERRWHDVGTDGTVYRRWMLCVPFAQKPSKPPVERSHES